MPDARTDLTLAGLNDRPEVLDIRRQLAERMLSAHARSMRISDPHVIARELADAAWNHLVMRGVIECVRGTDYERLCIEVGERDA